MKKIAVVFFVIAVMLLPLKALACTNFIVGKLASADGSVMVTYNDDAYGKYGFLDFYPAAFHKAGDVRRIINWEDGQYRGSIPEVAQTYNVVGNINEFQVCICETTFGGRHELIDKSGLLDYGSLIYIALQRSRTAREALKVMTDLVAEYGYCSSGESFSVCDKNEAWIMEMVGKGGDEKGAVWVAIRIPDDCVAVHANSSRITRFDMTDKKNVMHSKDVVSYARKKGFFSGKDADFSFRDAYSPEISIRSCESRCWSFMNKMDAEKMKAYLPYILGEKKTEIIDGKECPIAMPLYLKPDHKVSLSELKNLMRDHYEGTPLALTDDIGAGAWGLPYRPSPLTFDDSEGNTYFNERPISTQQTAFSLVAQLRSWLPDEVGGVMWFGCDDANMIAYTPVYCCTNKVPVAYAKETASAVDFNMNSAFWLCNALSNVVYMRYNLMIGDLRAVQSRLERQWEAEQTAIELKAKALNGDERRTYLTSLTDSYCSQMMAEWTRLFGYMMVKYNDMAVKNEKDGRFDTICHEKCRISRPGYPQPYKDAIAKQTGSRYFKSKKK